MGFNDTVSRATNAVNVRFAPLVVKGEMCKPPLMKRTKQNPVVDNQGRALLHGYARVSTDDQDLRMQIEALIRHGVDPDRIYRDKKSGKNLKRTGLQDLLAHIRGGEVLVVWRFDRLSRSLRDLVNLFEELDSRGIQLRSIHEQLDTTTPMGRLMFQLAGMLAEFERNLIAERTKLGMATAREHGRRFGPPRKIDDAKLDKIIEQLRVRQTDKRAVGELARRYRISTTTLRDRVLERTGGKRLWPKGPRAKR